MANLPVQHGEGRAKGRVLTDSVIAGCRPESRRAPDSGHSQPLSHNLRERRWVYETRRRPSQATLLRFGGLDRDRAAVIPDNQRYLHRIRGPN
jgi:hypothetical protein